MPAHSANGPTLCQPRRCWRCDARQECFQPLFLICMMIRFHALIENQPINSTWVGYLDGLSDKFRQIVR